MTADRSVDTADETIGGTAENPSRNPKLRRKARRVAVVIPCYSEEITIAKVVTDFRNALPEAEIYVFDNNSTDRSIEEATRAKATVVRSLQQGKGNVVRHIFQVVDADIYILVDGDDTYQAAAAPGMIEELENEQLDMLVGIRLGEYKDGGLPPLSLVWQHRHFWTHQRLLPKEAQRCPVRLSHPVTRLRRDRSDSSSGIRGRNRDDPAGFEQTSSSRRNGGPLRKPPARQHLEARYVQ